MKRSAKIFAVILALTAMSACLSVFPSAAKKLTSGVSILNPKKNIRGEGYEWNNPDDILTLNGLNIDTADDYGLKIPDGATVILKGKNTIKASKAALYIGGNVIIKGSGSLTLEGGESGILLNSTKNDDKLSLISGSYTVKGGDFGIKAEFSKIYIAGADIEADGGKYSINARELATGTGTSITANGSVYTSYSMLLEATDISVSSKDEGAALISDGTLKINNMSISAGSAIDSAISVEKYSGEKALKAESTLDTGIKSIIFGDKYSVALDILVLGGAVVILSAAIILPIVIKKKKARAIAASLEK